MFVNTPLLLRSTNMCMKLSKSKSQIPFMNNELISAAKIGVSVVGTGEIFAHIHDPHSMLLQFLLGTYTYGVDRMKNKDNILLYELLFTLNVVLLSNKDTLWFIPLLFLTKYYKYYKKHLGIFKPSYVAMLWSLACVALPYSVSHTYDTKYMCMQLLNCHLINYGVSNLLDIKDVDDDRKNNIMTVPVLFSDDVTYGISTSCIITSICGLLFEIYLHNKI